MPIIGFSNLLLFCHILRLQARKNKSPLKQRGDTPPRSMCNLPCTRAGPGWGGGRCRTPSTMPRCASRSWQRPLAAVGFGLIVTYSHPPLTQLVLATERVTAGRDKEMVLTAGSMDQWIHGVVRACSGGTSFPAWESCHKICWAIVNGQSEYQSGPLSRLSRVSISTKLWHILSMSMSIVDN